jgi:YVTN family beta-propeller protein
MSGLLHTILLSAVVACGLNSGAAVAASPPDAAKAVGATAYGAPVSAEDAEWLYVVRSGDTLWAIAERQLGDPRLWPTIASASASTVQPDGQRLTDPDLIRPGWALTVPEGPPRDEVPTAPAAEILVAGSLPSAVAVDSVAGAVYVADWDSGAIVVIDAENGTTTRTIPVGSRPSSVAVDSGAGVVYVADLGAHGSEGAISVVDTRASTVTSVPVGGSPRAVVVDPVGHALLVSGAGDDGVTVLDTATRSVAGRIALEAGAFSMVVSPEGGRAYVLSNQSGTISVIDTRTRQVIDKINVDQNALGLAMGSRADRLFVVNDVDDSGHGSVSVIDTKTGAVKDTIHLAGSPASGPPTAGRHPTGAAVVAPSGRLHVVNFGGSDEDEGTVSIINLDSRAIEEQVSVGEPWVGPPSGQVAAYDRDGTVYVVNRHCENCEDDEDDSGTGSVSVITPGHRD